MNNSTKHYGYLKNFLIVQKFMLTYLRIKTKNVDIVIEWDK
jgi:hypothetical protein